jgi:hypothetical protein
MSYKHLSILLLLSIGGLYCMIAYTTQHLLQNRTVETGNKNFTKPDTTEVFILGTTHQSKGFTVYDNLYNILERIKPDIILHERDSTAFDTKMNLKKTFRSYVFPDFLKRFQPSNLEEIAVRKYLHFNPLTVVRPYEWANRDKFHKENDILTKPDEIFSLLNQLDTTNKLSQPQKEILHTFYALSEQANKFGDSTFYAINSTLQDSITALRQLYQYQKIKIVIDENPHLEQYSAFYKINEAYWDIRNKAMANNIMQYIRLYPNSRIAVLNGYFHRYYLRQELLDEQSNLNFKLMDIGQ